MDANQNERRVNLVLRDVINTLNPVDLRKLAERINSVADAKDFAEVKQRLNGYP